MSRFTLIALLDKFTQGTIAPFYRRVGKHLIKYGTELQGSYTSDDRLVQSLTSVKANNQVPQNDSIFTAPNSVLVGNVKLAKNSSVWYGATLKGDNNPIEIGKNSLVQDNVYIQGPAVLKNNVYVGPNSRLDGCTVGDDGFVGMGSIIKSGSVVDGVVAAGSLVETGSNIKQGEVWAGSPAKYLRDLTPQEIQILREYKLELIQLAAIHAEENDKSNRDVIADIDTRFQKEYGTAEDRYMDELEKLNFPIELDDEEFIEQRVFMKEQTNMFQEPDYVKEQQDPYEQDFSKYPEHYKIYAEDFSLYEEAERFFKENPEARADQFQQKQQAQDESPWTHHKQFGHQEDGLRLWEAGVVLARYIHFNIEKSDKFYVDLGTGVGLAGIVLSQKCGRILLTDNNEQVLKNAWANVIENKSQVMMINLDWRNHQQIQIKCDCVIGSDLVYQGAPLDDLYHTVMKLLNHGGIFYLIIPNNRMATQEFLSIMEKSFTFEIEELSDEKYYKPCIKQDSIKWYPGLQELKFFMYKFTKK